MLKDTFRSILCISYSVYDMSERGGNDSDLDLSEKKESDQSEILNQIVEEYSAKIEFLKKVYGDTLQQISQKSNSHKGTQTEPESSPSMPIMVAKNAYSLAKNRYRQISKTDGASHVKHTNERRNTHGACVSHTLVENKYKNRMDLMKIQDSRDSSIWPASRPIRTSKSHSHNHIAP